VSNNNYDNEKKELRQETEVARQELESIKSDFAEFQKGLREVEQIMAYWDKSAVRKKSGRLHNEP
jgi:hypothetical protein